MTDNLGQKYLEKYSNRVNPLIDNYLKQEIKKTSLLGKVPTELIEKFAFIVKRGKKLRGALVVLGYQIAGGENLKEINEVSLFIELFQAGILIHDDIMDRSEIRRGSSTIHKQYKPLHYGESMAINAGDLAFYFSMEKLASTNFLPERLIKANKIYTDYIKKVIYGQILDISNTNINSIKEKDILNIFRYKTAEYTGVLPLLIGATLAGLEDNNKIQVLKDYGLFLGWAFQIQDDILGMFGKEKNTGKPVGDDLREGKITLLVLHLLKHGIPSQIKSLKKVLGKKDLIDKDILEMQEIFKKAGSYDYIVKLGYQYVTKGKNLISQLTKNPDTAEVLESLITFMMERIK